MAVDYVEDPITRIVSITMTGTADEQFLYSDTNGMLASRDGFNWQPAASSVAAVSMAYGEGVWIAVDLGGSMWRSEDYTKTWQPVSAESMNAVGYIRPKDARPDEPGVFAGTFLFESAALAPAIYASFDLGKTWSQVYAPPEDYHFFANSFSGCGGKFFLCADEASEGMLTDGYAHVSGDGRSWSRVPVFTGATANDIFATLITKQNHNIDFDRKAETYYAVGFSQYADLPAQTTTNYVIYATSGDGLSFGGESPIKSTFIPRGGGGDGFISPAGRHVGAGVGTVGTLMLNIFAGDIGQTEYSVEATVGPGGHPLFRQNPEGGYVTQMSPVGVRFCVTNKETGAGAFAAVAFGFNKDGGIWTSTGGGWSQTHSGRPFHDGNQNSHSTVGLAVGKVILASEVTPP